MPLPLVVFSHGKESGPMGSKIQALMRVAESRGFQCLSVDYRRAKEEVPLSENDQGEADRRVQKLLNTQQPPHDKLVLVGSSMGGYVSTVASGLLQPDGLFLLAPAFYLPGYAVQSPTTQTRQLLVVHGWRDDVIPPSHSWRFCQDHACQLHMLDGDHRLNSSLAQIEVLFDQFLTQTVSASATP